MNTTLAALFMNCNLSDSMRLCRVLLPVLMPLLTIACGDELTQDWLDSPDTVQLFSLSRPELIGQASAFDFVNHVPVAVENPDASGRWDVALTDQGGAFSLVPAGAFTGLASRAGIATVTGTTLEALREAPGDTSRYSGEAVAIQMGTVYVVRSRREGCGLGAGSRYSKIEVVDQDPAEGSIRFRAVTNPYCDRKLIPPK